MSARRALDVTGTRWATRLWWMSAVAIPLAAVAAVLAGDDRWFGPAPLSAFARAQIAARVFMTETALTIVAAPLAGVWCAIRARPTGVAGRTGLVSTVLEAWPVALRVAAGATLLVLTSVAITLVMGPPATATLWLSHAVLWSAALALAALGTLSAATLRDPLDAAACAVGTATVVAIGLLVAGPVMADAPTYVLSATLMASPLVATASSANIDIFRLDPLYQLSPLAHTRVEYPTPGAALAWYLGSALVLFLGTVLTINRRARAFPVERMSA